MKPFFISATCCELTKVGETVSRQAINSAIHSSQSESKARARIAAIVRRARLKRDQAHDQAEKIIQDAYKEAQRLQEAWKEEAQQRATSDAVTWLLDKEKVERSLIDNLKERIRQQMRIVIEKWSSTQDISQFMIKRLSDQVALMSNQHDLTLFVPQERYSVMEDVFGEQLNVKVKSELHGAQAELSSEYLVIRLDLDLQLQLLLDSFSENKALQQIASGD
ncbi:type III secretion protein [Vibrio sp. Of14-4]|uniref:type III secretion protein n=1 Tax=Vibrio sp. Of14-4 TaxID=2724878 RepID=UPI001EF2DD22|nr:type III secretion protein [Vibrio sp. Of14-4]MCG7490136.1 type III secretion protein [Vibrio sp. Of14-4]